MRFSLKDLLISMALACAGLGCLGVFLSELRQEFHYGPAGLLLVWLVGPLFGAALGRLFHQVERGFWIGFFLEFLCLPIIMMLWMQLHA